MKVTNRRVLMKYYFDITLLPDAGIHLGFIWQRVYQQVHIVLVEHKRDENKSDVALSFPQYGNNKFPLGSKIRLLAATTQHLEKLAINRLLVRFSDYAHITSIRAVPDAVDKFACFKRKQYNTNLERLARRRVKRHNEVFEKALDYYSSFKEEESKLPFINVKSVSTDHLFRIFITQEIASHAIEGDFNCYGLSNAGATVPWF